MSDKNDKSLELTQDELEEIQEELNQADTDEYESVSTYYFSNPDPYAKVESNPDAPKRDVSFDENGNIVVKNLSAFWLPDVKIVDEIGGTEYTVTGSYEGSETLDKKLKRIMEQNTDIDNTGITEDSDG